MIFLLDDELQPGDPAAFPDFFQFKGQVALTVSGLVFLIELLFRLAYDPPVKIFKNRILTCFYS